MNINSIRFHSCSPLLDKCYPIVNFLDPGKRINRARWGDARHNDRERKHRTARGQQQMKKMTQRYRLVVVIRFLESLCNKKNTKKPHSSNKSQYTYRTLDWKFYRNELHFSSPNTYASHSERWNSKNIKKNIFKKGYIFILLIGTGITFSWTMVRVLQMDIELNSWTPPPSQGTFRTPW